MSKFFLTLSCCGFLLISSFSQGVGIGTINPDTSAIFELKSSSKGMLIPRMTQAERNSIFSPAQGLLLFQVDSINGFYYYNSGHWETLGNNNNNVGSSFIVYSKTTANGQEIWKADITGNNQQRININLPVGFSLNVNNDGGQLRVTSDKQKIIFKARSSNSFSLFSCSIDGSNVNKIVDDVGTSFTSD